MSTSVRVNYTNGYIVEFVEAGKEACSSWLLLPAENLWATWLRGILYILCLLWFFMGIAIISDVFMSSIEVITSKKRKVLRWDETQQKKVEIEVLIWNETVANLTLMALGSSAPEILLAVIETGLRLGQDTGDGLGTFTIIGSAAFNLLIITAICIVSVPAPNVKKIREFGVFGVTAVWSLWAYIWMLLVVQYISPGVVEPWEAWVTLGYMPLFVFVSYCQDNGWWCRKRKVDDDIGTDSTSDDPHVRVLTNRQRTGSFMGHLPKELVTLEAEKAHRLSIFSLTKPPTEPGEKIVYVASVDNNSVRRANHDPEANINYCLKELDESEDTCSDGSKDPETGSIRNEDRPLRKRAHEEPKAFARARFRHAAVYAMTGRHMKPVEKFPHMADIVHQIQAMSDYAKTGKVSDKNLCGKFTFSSTNYAVMESAGLLEIDVLFHRRVPPRGMCVVNGGTLLARRSSKAAIPAWSPTLTEETEFMGPPKDGEEDVVKNIVAVDFETREGTAKLGKDFTHTCGKLVFLENEYRKKIAIPILKENHDSDVDFYILLKNPEGGAGLGDPSVSRITIIDDDEPGHFMFEQPRYNADMSKGALTATVVRQNGCDGKVTLEYSTMDGTAVGGKELGEGIDYVKTNGEITFQHGELSRDITIPVDPNSKGSKNFVLTLRNPTDGAKIGDVSAAICNINTDELAERIADAIEGESTEEVSWPEQFKNAMTVGGDGDDDDDGPSALEFFLHFCTFFWKILFAFTPPTKYLGAWPAFVISLVFLAGLTAVVEQLGHLLGCVIGLKTSVTGITIIALGTSLPDTFASRTAAMQDEYADAAIGNVTGSNSVNVFLGLGLQWVISTMYYLARGETYTVSTGTLVQAVLLFTCCGIICIILLCVRRKLVGGELGGKNKLGRWFSGLLLIFLWVAYIIVSSLRAYNVITW